MALAAMTADATEASFGRFGMGGGTLDAEAVVEMLREGRLGGADGGGVGGMTCTALWSSLFSPA